MDDNTPSCLKVGCWLVVLLLFEGFLILLDIWRGRSLSGVIFDSLVLLVLFGLWGLWDRAPELLGR